MKCQTCQHPQREVIDLALLTENHTFAYLSEQYGLSASSLFRHKQHLAEKMLRASQRLQESQDLVSLLKLSAYLDQVQRAVQKAEAEGNVNQVLKGAQVGSRLIRQIGKMEVTLELDTVYRLISSHQWTTQNSLLPTDPQIVTAIHQAVTDIAFTPCPDEEPENLPADIDPKNKREITEKIPKNLTLGNENNLPYQQDIQCEKNLPKNPDSGPSACSPQTQNSLGTQDSELRTEPAAGTDPKTKREISAKLPKKMSLLEEYAMQNQEDTQCEKILSKNPDVGRESEAHPAMCPESLSPPESPPAGAAVNSAPMPFPVPSSLFHGVSPSASREFETLSPGTRNSELETYPPGLTPELRQQLFTRLFPERDGAREPAKIPPQPQSPIYTKISNLFRMFRKKQGASQEALGRESQPPAAAPPACAPSNSNPIPFRVPSSLFPGISPDCHAKI